MERTVTIKSVAEMDAFAAEVVGHARRLQKERGANAGAFVIGLSGDLGAGKTAFAQSVAKTLCVTETVQSPTFILERVYAIADDVFARLVHIDAYRLDAGDGLQSLGWSDISTDMRNLILIEWPERVADSLPNDALRLTFTYIDEQTREIAVPF